MSIVFKYPNGATLNAKSPVPNNIGSKPYRVKMATNIDSIFKGLGSLSLKFANTKKYSEMAKIRSKRVRDAIPPTGIRKPCRLYRSHIIM